MSAALAASQEALDVFCRAYARFLAAAAGLADALRAEPAATPRALELASSLEISMDVWREAARRFVSDFPLLPLPTSSVASDSPPARSIPTAPDPKPTLQFSRFTVSPSNVSRFSITHISDSDMDSAGGGSPLSHNSLSS